MDAVSAQQQASPSLSSHDSSASLAPPEPPVKVGEERRPSLSVLNDPLLELCPSLHSLQALCAASVADLPNQDEEARTQHLEKIFLRAASVGDTELLSWFCYASTNNVALKQFEWRALRDEDGSGPLVLATQSGHADAVQLLVQHGANVDERDALGWTPLMWATNSSNLPLVSFLLSHGADVEAKSSKGATCEDFILSSTPDVGTSSYASLSLSTSLAGPSRLKEPQTPRSTDQHLIADLVFEQQQAIVAERQRNSKRHRLRSIGSSGSSREGSDNESMATSRAYQASTSVTSTGSVSTRSAHSRSSSMTMRRIMGRNERTQIAEADLKARELAEGRRRALLDVAVMMEVSYADLIGEEPTSSDSLNNARKRRGKRKAGLSQISKTVHSGLSAGCGALEVGGDPLSVEFDFDTVRPDQMLVLGHNDVQPLLQRLITEAKPVRAPWIARSKPANVLFMCLRFACSLDDDALLEDIMFSAVDLIEADLYAHPTEMTHLAYWLSNGMLLLHYMQRDKTLQESEAMPEFHNLLAELINEIYVFVVRDLERRLDKVMDAAILDHNPLPGFDEVRFEGEWSFMKSLAGSVKRASQSNSSSPAPKRPLSQIFGSDPTPSGSSPSTPTRRNPSISISPATPSKQMADLQEASHDATAADLMSKPVPRTITLLLTSALHILQLYEVNPCVIVQALSQVFFWLGCELFNRVLTQKKYLCKSKAMQIRLNVSALEDWVKTNALPLSIVNQHLARLNRLISWLLCQSSLLDFDGLIATMQGLRDLNPPQLLKTVKDYRYEVGETRMNEECLAYLDQLYSDWGKARHEDRQKKDRHHHLRSGTATQDNPDGAIDSEEEEEEEEHDEEDGEESDEEQSSDFPEDHEGDEEQHDTAADNEEEKQKDVDDPHDNTIDSTITTRPNDMPKPKPKPKPMRKGSTRKAQAIQRGLDRLFETGQSMNDYTPPPQREAISMLLNSRDMLPFALPSQTHALIVSPGDAFGFGRGHFMGTGSPSLKSFRNGSLLGAKGGGSSSSSSLPGSPALGSSAASSSESSSHSNWSPSKGPGLGSSSRLYPQGKGLAAGSYWQPVPILPEDTLEEIESIMRTVEQQLRFHAHTTNSSSGGGNGSTRLFVDTRLSEAALQSPVLSTARATRSPFFAHVDLPSEGGTPSPVGDEKA